MGVGYDDDFQGPSPIQEMGFSAVESPKFGGNALFSMLNNIA
jgi:hypothetical protein